MHFNIIFLTALLISQVHVLRGFPTKILLLVAQPTITYDCISRSQCHACTVYSVQVCLHCVHTEFPHFLLQRCASYCHPTEAN